MILYQEENALDVLQEVYPLLCEHYEELSVHRTKGLKLEPNYAAYTVLAENNMLCVTTARRAGNLVGYAAYIISPHLHYSSVINAEGDVFFLTKDCRQGLIGYRLLQESEKHVLSRGATHIVQKCKVFFDVSALFKRLGYMEIEKVFLKEL